MLAFPFDSRVEVVENPITHEPETQFDRAVSSQPMRHLMRKLFTTGIMPDLSDNYLVSAGTDGMTVVVHSGFAVVDGGLALETENRTLEVTAADTTLDRIDTVVLRWNENVDVRTADLYVVSGTPAANPVRPELQRGESIYEIGLADIFITRSVATITNEKITDTRYEAERCGVVRSISEYDTTYIYQQVQADLASFKANEESTFATWSTAQRTAFEEWFETIQDILDENVAAHLQNEIDDLKKGTGVFYNTDAEAEADIDNIEDGAIVYTNDGEDEPINARQIRYDDGTQQGSNVETQIKKKALVNTYYNSSTKKLYEVNSDGTQGGEIPMNRMLDWANSQHRNTSGSINVNTDSKVLGFLRGTSTQALCTIKVTIDDHNYTAMQVANDNTNASNEFDVPAGATVSLSTTGNWGYITVIPYI